MRIRLIIRSLLSYFPGFLDFFKKGTGGTDSARYCYSVWLRHLVKLNEAGMKNIPNCIAEIGPGDSFGIGLCALLSGSNQYFAFEIIEHSNIERNIEIFDELVELFRNRTPIPDDNEFPKVKPKLVNYEFPDKLLTKAHLSHCLNKHRIENITNALKGIHNDEIIIKYIVPWAFDSKNINPNVDLIFSQAVMEHIKDVNDSYSNMYDWLNYKGYMSHQIDFSAHETHKKWHGHWKYGINTWNFIMHGRSYYINRYPNSYHVSSLKKNGFTVLNQTPFYKESATSVNSKLNKNIDFTNDDLRTASNLIIVNKTYK